MITAHHLVFGRKYGGFKIPFLSSNRMSLTISTRKGNIIVKHLDGTTLYIAPVKNSDLTVTSGTLLSKTYNTFYSGDLEVNTLSGNEDVYSLSFGYDAASAPSILGGRYDIQDLGTFFAQFPNLYSINYNIYAYGSNANRLS